MQVFPLAAYKLAAASRGQKLMWYAYHQWSFGVKLIGKRALSLSRDLAKFEDTMTF